MKSRRLQSDRLYTFDRVEKVLFHPGELNHEHRVQFYIKKRDYKYRL